MRGACAFAGVAEDDRELVGDPRLITTGRGLSSMDQFVVNRYYSLQHLELE